MSLQKKEKTMRSMQFLPQEIVIEVLSRLPSKSLLRFTCVCKSWYSLITEPSFISLHYHRSSSSFLLQFTKKPLDPNAGRLPYQNSIRHTPLLTAASNSSIPLPSSFDGVIVAIYHGLICLSNDRGRSSFIICNPSLRRFLRLPEPNLDSMVNDTKKNFFNIGFGFDSRNDDYKLVRISSESRWVSFSEAQVYSLSSGFWRKLRLTIAPFCVTSFIMTANGHGLVNGLVHWGARRKVEEGNHSSWYLFVLSFDFQREVFHEVMLPECLAYGSVNWDMVTVVGGGNFDMNLTVSHMNRIDQQHLSCSIWVMKEYGVVKSWNKLFAYDLIDSCLQAPSFGITIPDMYQMLPPTTLCVMNNGEILMLRYKHSLGKESLYLLDVGKKSLVDLQIQLGGEDYTWWYQYVGDYTESLVLLNNNVYVGSLESY